MECTIRKASKNEHRAIFHLLASNRLPTDDIHEEDIEFFIGLVNDRIVATVALEYYGCNALLRSLCVHDDFKRQHIGHDLLRRMTNECDTQRVTTLYLLTTNAQSYFKRFGFETITREETPSDIRYTREFQSLCPSSAILMQKRL